MNLSHQMLDALATSPSSAGEIPSLSEESQGACKELVGSCVHPRTHPRRPSPHPPRSQAAALVDVILCPQRGVLVRCDELPPLEQGHLLLQPHLLSDPRLAPRPEVLPCVLRLFPRDGRPVRAAPLEVGYPRLQTVQPLDQRPLDLILQLQRGGYRRGQSQRGLSTSRVRSPSSARTSLKTRARTRSRTRPGWS